MSAKHTHCRDCGNPDCPNVSATPYWRRCPASDRKAKQAPVATTEGTWDGFGWPPGCGEKAKTEASR